MEKDVSCILDDSFMSPLLLAAPVAEKTFLINVSTVDHMSSILY